jgi:tRNA-2-methylthio-N6-dimethylallyladenosine synthase
MHRIYTVEEYLDKVRMLKEIVPNVALGTDIIVGFPTETEEEFQMTYDIMKEIEYSVAFIYTYSPRKGTPAMRWKDDIPEEVKETRLHKLLKLQEPIYQKHRLHLLGEEVEVLVEKKNFKDESFMKGRTRCWKNVLFKGDESHIGTLQTIKVHSVNNQTLIGEIVARPSF